VKVVRVARRERRGEDQRSPSRSWRVVGGLAVVVCALAWSVVIWVWPGLYLGDSAGSRSLQSAVLIASASIAAAVIVFGLAVGAIVLQVMANYSWAVVRIVLSGWLAPVLLFVVSGSVVFPLWVSFSPSARLSSAAFAAFGWAILIVGASVWEIVRVMNPQSISATACRRSVVVLSRGRRRETRQVVAKVFGELVTGAVLPYDEGLRLVGSYTMILADQARSGSLEEVAVAVRAMSARAMSVESPALAVSIVRALRILGLDQSECPRVFDEVHDVLIAIARYGRGCGQRGLAEAALDALMDITVECLGRALPSVGYRIPPKPPVPPPPPERLENGFFPRRVFPSSLPPEADEGDVTPAEPQSNRRELLSRFVQGFASESSTLAGGLAEVLASGLARSNGADEPVARTDTRPWWSHFDVFEETVDVLTSLLPSPLPSSTGWPAGWQGPGAFDADVQRLTSLANRLYLQSKHLSMDLVEGALELIGVRLRAEQLPATDLPAARTGWRYPPTRREAGGIAAVTASCLSTLMGSAFDAGFDRRTLSTGLRILASATASAKAGDCAATVAYTDALGTFTRDKSLHGFEAGSEAGGHRAEVVLIGLIAECDQLIDVAREQTGHHSEIHEAIENLFSALAWKAPRSSVFSTVIAMLQTRLVAAGWPVALASGQRRLYRVDEPVARPEAKPLSGALLSDTEELYSDWIGHGEIRLPAAALMMLWAHAAAAARDGAIDEVQRVAAFLAEQLHSYDCRYAEMPAPLAAPGEEQQPGFQPLDPHLRRLTSAAIRWCKRADPIIVPTIPRAPGPRTVRAIGRLLVSQPDTPNWVYRGFENLDEMRLITVQMPDQSRRVLRDSEVRTDELNWGYYGSGPHNLAPVLLADILADYRECPDCLGASPLAVGMVRCRSCSNTGRRPGTARAERRLLDIVIGKLPDQFERTRLEILRDHALQGARTRPERATQFPSPSPAISLTRLEGGDGRYGPEPHRADNGP
jgi:hypothetical protein